MQYGLIGKKLQHSFSQKHFEKKFTKLGLHHSYSNFEMDTLDSFRELILKTPNLKGLNVTIPYKQEIIKYLDDIDTEALKIGAVNTVTINKGRTKGYNTDVYGFEQSLKSSLNKQVNKAIILGTGGASLAVAYVLEKLGLEFQKVSRSPKSNQISYKEAENNISSYQIIINTTPLGTYPDIQNQPPLSLARLNKKHLVFDMIYNPARTLFLQEAEQKGCRIINGQEMLELQADKSWEIWNEF